MEQRSKVAAQQQSGTRGKQQCSQVAANSKYNACIVRLRSKASVARDLVTSVASHRLQESTKSATLAYSGP